MTRVCVSTMLFVSLLSPLSVPADDAQPASDANVAHQRSLEQRVERLEKRVQRIVERGNSDDASSGPSVAARTVAAPAAAPPAKDPRLGGRAVKATDSRLGNTSSLPIGSICECQTNVSTFSGTLRSLTDEWVVLTGNPGEYWIPRTSVQSLLFKKVRGQQGEPELRTTTTIQLDERYLRYATGQINKYDSNGDGVLTKDEWSAMTKDPSESDQNGDGEITADELAKWMAQR